MNDISLPPLFSDDQKFVAEWQKMLAGDVYEASYRPFILLLQQTRRKIREYNDADPADGDTLSYLAKEILGATGDKINIVQPFRCDFGCNIRVGENFMANFNFTVLDEGLVTIGDNAFIGPNVGIYTACHPIDPAERNKGVEWAKPVTIGNNVWIGGGTTILPGVTIGDNVIIGAGSVVARDIPSDTVAVGNPCHPVKSIK